VENLLAERVSALSAKGKSAAKWLEKENEHGFFRVFSFNTTIDGPRAEIESTLGQKLIAYALR